MERYTAIQLARLTIQSSGCEPPLPPGGIPELTTADVAMCAAAIKNPNAYHAIMAKCCEHKVSIEKTEKHTFDHSWILWLQQGNKIPTSTPIHKKLAKVAVAEYMHPGAMAQHSEEEKAKTIGVGRSTWFANYIQHYRELTAYLYRLETDGLRDVKRAMK